ncbi:putative sulfate exporter family transporter [Anaerospora sp.]|jgi:uncharacterized integral membrane protein (TIGR00698 family)|uniref:YeiH family protein n=1 Tax=Anaerospora sp. TaxID=1960278 RepID=UPI0028988FE3|nr:putative sulfate exporter family transporter [Anaerospora sp.]
MKDGERSLFIPGIAITFLIAVPAWYLGTKIPLIGGPVFGMLLGIITAICKPPPPCCRAGIQFTSKYFLQLSVILLGFEMNLFHVLAIGSQSLAIMFFTISAAFCVAWMIGRGLNLSGNTAILIGVGTAICGGSAIAATAPAIAAKEREVAYSLSTIFLFNIAAVFIFPVLGHYLKMSDLGFGLWAGTAINDTSSVVAASYSYSEAAGNFATIVKLTRTLMIIPITIILAIITAKKTAADSEFNLAKTFPWFIVGFLAASLVSTSGVFSEELCAALAHAGKFLIIAAMTAVGLSIDLRQMASNGVRPILLGLMCWASVAVVSLGVQYYLELW